MATFISNPHNTLEDTHNHLNSLKLNSYTGENVEDCCFGILIDSERLDIARAFNTEHLGYIN